MVVAFVVVDAAVVFMLVDLVEVLGDADPERADCKTGT